MILIEYINVFLWGGIAVELAVIYLLLLRRKK